MMYHFSWKNTDFVTNILLCECMLSQFTRVQLFVTLWTIDCQVPRSMGFSR